MIGTSVLQLPRADWSLEAYAAGSPSPWPKQAAPPRSRLAMAAAHIVADPPAAVDPWLDTAAIDATTRMKLVLALAGL